MIKNVSWNEQMWDLEHLGSTFSNVIAPLMPAIILIFHLVRVKQVTVMQSNAFQTNQIAVYQQRNKDFASAFGLDYKSIKPAKYINIS